MDHKVAHGAIPVLCVILQLLPGSILAQNHNVSVQSHRPYDATIVLSPADVNGDSTGTSRFERVYPHGTSLTATAPASVEGNTFQKWVRIDPSTGSPVEEVTTAEYTFTVDAAYDLEVFFQNEERPTDAVTISIPHAATYDLDPDDTDVDWYRLDLSTGTSYHIFNTGSPTYPVDYHLFGPGDAAGTDIGDHRGNACCSEGFVEMVFTPSSAGYYYLRVASMHNWPDIPPGYGPDINADDSVSEPAAPSVVESYTLNVEDVGLARTVEVWSERPGFNVPIGVSPADITGQSDGQTRFSRSYVDGTPVSVTAPVSVEGNTFQKWQRLDPSDWSVIEEVTTNAYGFTALDNYIVRAVFQNEERPTDALTISIPHTGTYDLDPRFTDVDWYRLNLTSSTSYHIYNTNSPAFSVEYHVFGPGDAAGTVIGDILADACCREGEVDITFTPPSDGYYYLRVAHPGNSPDWPPGYGPDANASVPAAANAPDSPDAAEPYTLNVEDIGLLRNIAISSVRPPWGVPIGVSPADQYGETDGETHFERRYPDATSITVTAPASYEGNTFQKWQRFDRGTWALVDEAVTTSYIFIADDDYQVEAVFQNEERPTDAVTVSVPHTGNYDLDHPETDVDWYRLDLSSANGYRFYNTNSPTFGIAYHLFGPGDAAGNNIGGQQAGACCGEGEVDLLFVPPETGYYYLRVSSPSNGPDESGYGPEQQALDATAQFAPQSPTAAEPYTLNVENLGQLRRIEVSSARPPWGVPVTVSPADLTGSTDGNTWFDRFYSDGTSVTLTAPASFDENTFQKWQRIDPVTWSVVEEVATLAYNFTADAWYIVEAVFQNEERPTDAVTVTVPHSSTYDLDPPETDVDWYRLDLASATTYRFFNSGSPTFGVAYHLFGPGDAAGTDIGPERASACCDEGTVHFTFTPDTPGYYYLRVASASNWPDEFGYGPDRQPQGAAGQNDPAQAMMAEPYTLNVENLGLVHRVELSSERPSWDTPIAVSPADINGDSDGTTNFERYYLDGTSTTLTAPAFADDNPFQKWERYNQDKTTLIEEVTTNPYTFTVDNSFFLEAIFENLERPTDAVTISIPHSENYDLDPLRGDVDWYRMDLVSTTSFRLYNTNTADGRIRYHLFGPGDAVGTDIGELLAEACCSNDVEILFTPATSGYYYLRVAHHRNWPEWPEGYGPESETATGNGYPDANTPTVSASYTLNVEDIGLARTILISSERPPFGVHVTVSPTDLHGETDGSTDFERLYPNATSVTVTAPASVGGNTFEKWQRFDRATHSLVEEVTTLAYMFTVEDDYDLEAVFINDESATGATTIGVPHNADHVLDPDFTDVDWYQVELVESIEYAFYTYSGQSFDLAVWIFGPGTPDGSDPGPLVALDDDNGGNNQPLLYFMPVTSGTYYLWVSHDGNYPDVPYAIPGSKIEGHSAGVSADKRSVPLAPIATDYTLNVEHVVHANITLLLEGPYSAPASMSTALNAGAHLPTSDPIGVSAATPAAVPDDDISPQNGIPDHFDQRPDIVDWVTVSIRADEASATIVEDAAFVLQDGSLRDIDDIPGIRLVGAAPGSYFVVVGHRNHVQAMSDAAVDFSSGVGTHDFTGGAAYGVDPMKHLGGGVYGLYTGDANLDGGVQALDLGEYTAQAALGAMGYQSADFNMDAMVQALDFNLYIANAATGASSQVP